MASKRKRIEYILGPLGAAGTAILFAVILWPPCEGSRCAPHQAITHLVDQLVKRDGINPIELSEIAGYPVRRVCFGPEYASVLSIAERYGASVDVPADATIPESSYGLFMIGDDGTTYGALHYSEFTGTTIGCRTGSRLALKFDETTPPTGGRLVDLDAPDLRPTLVEAL